MIVPVRGTRAQVSSLRSRRARHCIRGRNTDCRHRPVPAPQATGVEPRGTEHRLDRTENIRNKVAKSSPSDVGSIVRLSLGTQQQGSTRSAAVLGSCWEYGSCRSSDTDVFAKALVRGLRCGGEALAARITLHCACVPIVSTCRSGCSDTSFPGCGAARRRNQHDERKSSVRYGSSVPRALVYTDTRVGASDSPPQHTILVEFGRLIGGQQAFIDLHTLRAVGTEPPRIADDDGVVIEFWFHDRDATRLEA
jgi:hypothetical protein